MADTQMATHVGASAPHLENGLINVTPTDAHAAITEINAKTSPLLRLPAELRAKIWEYALDGHTIRLQPDLDTNIGIRLSHKLSFLPSEPHRFSLLRVSRQVYVETAILPYTLSTFCFVRWWDFVDRWLPSIEGHEYALARNIRKLKFGNLCFHPCNMRGLRDDFPALEKVEMRTDKRMLAMCRELSGQWDQWIGAAVAMDVCEVDLFDWFGQWASGSWEECEVLTSFGKRA